MVKLSREYRWEEAQSTFINQRVLVRLLVKIHSEFQNAATNLFHHAFQAATTHNLNWFIVHDHARLDVQTINLMRTLRQLKSPVAFLSILRGVFRPRDPLKVNTCGFDCQLSINNESEDSFLLVIYADICGQVMSKWQFGREFPFVLLKAIALTGAILASTDKQKALAERIREEWNDCWTHGIRAKWGQRRHFFEPPLSVKLKNVSLLEDSFLIYREDSESVFAQVDKVLEINLREAKRWLGNFTLSITNLQQLLCFELTHIFFPIPNVEMFTTAL